MSKTGGDMATMILTKVADPNFTIDDALVYINDCVRIIAGKINLSTLEQYAEVLTIAGVDMVTLPSDYMKNLFFAKNVTIGSMLNVWPSLAAMRRVISDTSKVGSVNDICVQGSSLRYAMLPSSPETLSIVYHRYPAVVTELGFEDISTAENADPIWNTIFHYGCKELFGIIEDGIDGETINTNNHTRLYLYNLGEAEKTTTQKSYRPPPISRGCFG